MSKVHLCYIKFVGLLLFTRSSSHVKVRLLYRGGRYWSHTSFPVGFGLLHDFLELVLSFSFACLHQGSVLVRLSDPMLSDSVVDVLFLGARVCKHFIEGLHLSQLCVCSLMLFTQLTRLDSDLRCDG